MDDKTTDRITRRRVLAALMIVGILSMAGCKPKSAEVTTSVIPVPAPSTTNAPVSHGSLPLSTGLGVDPHAMSPTGLNPHATMDVGATQGLTPTPTLDAEIKDVEKHGGSKKVLAELYTQRGDARMMDSQASPHLKYTAALSDYRKALKLDPANKTAANNKQLIEGVYRGMGRPIPTD